MKKIGSIEVLSVAGSLEICLRTQLRGQTVEVIGKDITQALNLLSDEITALLDKIVLEAGIKVGTDQ